MSWSRSVLCSAIVALAGCSSVNTSSPAELYVDAVKLDITSATATSTIAAGLRTVRVTLPADTDRATPGDDEVWTYEFELGEDVFTGAPIGTEVFAHGTATFAAGAPPFTYVPTPVGNPAVSRSALYATTVATAARPTSGSQVADGSVFLTARSSEVVRIYVDSHLSGIVRPDGAPHAAILRLTVDVPVNP